MAPRLLSKTALLTTTILASGTAAFAQTEGESTAADDQQPVEEIVVTGDFIPDEKRATSEIANVLDAEDFTRTGDADMAAALRRVTGLSVVDGKFVFVRGLGKRYTNATLDGAPLPSPEPLSRTVPLDLFPTSFIGNTLVQKTFSPEYPGQFGGGIIALRTQRLPDERRFKLGASVEANTVTTFQDGLTLTGGDLDFLGIDDGFRSIPDLLQQDPLLETFAADSPEREQIGEALPKTWSPDREPLPPGVGFNVNYTDRFNFSDTSLGLQVGVSYDSSLQTRNGIRQAFAASGGDELAINESFTEEGCEEGLVALQNTDPGRAQEIIDGCGVQSTEWEIRLNGFLNIGLDFGNDHSLKATQLLLRQTTRENIIEQGVGFEGDVESRVRNDWIERQLWFSQVTGEHYLNLFGDSDFFTGDLEVNWRGSFATADRDTPLRRTFFFAFNEQTGVSTLDPGNDANRTVFGDLADDQYGAGIDILQPMNWGGMQVDFKAGYAYEKKERESSFLRYFFNLDDSDADRSLIPEFIFTDENIGPDLFIEEVTDPSDSFTADFENHQAYVGLDAQVFEAVRVAVGGRYEDSTQTADAFRLVTGDPLNTTIDEDYFLPAATLTWEFNRNMQLRAAASKTISRPDLREIAETRFIDPDRDRFIAGNPDLVNSELLNFDMRWEWYFGRQDQITLGVFYKEIDNPIERVIRIEGSNRVFSFFNRVFFVPGTEQADIRLQGGEIPAGTENLEIADTTADLLGLEFEVQKYFDVADWLEWDILEDKDFFIFGNFSLIDSEVSIDQRVVEPLQLTNATRRLQGQSKYIVNTQIGYEDLIKGEKMTLVVNWQSERLQEVGTLGRPDVFETPPVLLDFVYSREFEWGGTLMQVQLNAENLLNEEEFLSQGGRTFENFDIGRSFSISVSAEF